MDPLSGEAQVMPASASRDEAGAAQAEAWDAAAAAAGSPVRPSAQAVTGGGGGAGGPRRRQANVSGGRPFTHQVKVSEAEEAVLIRMSEAAKLSVPRLLVEATLASDGPMRADQARDLLTALFGVQRLLGSISWNVNQVAVAVNSTHELPEQTAAVFEAALRVAQRVEAVIEDLPTVSQVRASEHSRRRRRVAALFGEDAAARLVQDQSALGDPGSSGDSGGLGGEPR